MMLYLPEVCGWMGMDVETWQTRNNKIDLRIPKTGQRGKEVRVRRRKEQNSGVGMKMV
jgi:hypothetical protein